MWNSIRPCSRRRLTLATCAVALLSSLFTIAACGGGGGGDAGPPPPEEIALGQFSSTTPTRLGRSWLNPLAGTATVTALASTGPFSFDPADLPATVPPGGTLNIGVIFTPEGPGPAEGLVTLLFDAGGQNTTRSYLLRAAGEPLGWTVTPTPLDFADILPGDEAELDVQIRNDSQQSPVTFTSAVLPGAAYSFVTDPFPLAVNPGQTATVRLKFAPTAIANYGGLLRMGPGDPGGPLDIALAGVSSGAGEQIIDLGTQTVTNGETPELTVDVPADAISVTFEGSGASGDRIGLRMLEGPDDGFGARLYETTARVGPVFWDFHSRMFSIHIPSSDVGGTQLVPGGGTYRFQLFQETANSATMDVRVIIERRPAGADTTTVLPLNIFLAPGLVPTAATAANNANLQSVLTQVGQIFAPQNIQLGDIDYYDIGDASFNAIAPGEEGALFALSSQASKVRLNLFLVQNVWNGGLLGLSAALDGAKQNGSEMNGVVSLYFEGQTGAIAAVIAHELSHYLGLWHIVEGDGTFDSIADTLECPVRGTGNGCTVEGGGYLMYWQGNGGTTLTNGQGKVLRGHPCCHPPSQQNTKPSKATPWVMDEKTRAFFAARSKPWCGTVRRR